MPVILFKHNLIKIGKRQYRNPIYLAKEWRRALDKGQYPSLAAFARHLKVSRARVTQIINLLRLSPEAIALVSSLGDPLNGHVVAERSLRPLVEMDHGEQVERINKLLPRD